MEIRAEITKKVTTKQLPKSYRFVFAVPMAETARSLVMNLVKADAFYPNTARNVEERKRFMTLAIADCNQQESNRYATNSGLSSTGRRRGS